MKLLLALDWFPDAYQVERMHGAAELRCTVLVAAPDKIYCNKLYSNASAACIELFLVFEVCFDNVCIHFSCFEKGPDQNVPFFEINFDVNSLYRT